jgi:hypothetical protein
MSRLFVATRKGLFTVEDGAAGRWFVARSAFLGDNVSMVLADPRDGTVYAALEHGHFGAKMHRSSDGVKWEECAVPAYPPLPEDVTDCDAWGKPIPWKVMRIWALETGGPDEPGMLWCGTIPGALFRSSDGGASWQWVRSLWDHPGRKNWFGGGADLPGIHSISIHPNDSRHVTVGVSCGGVWVTTDGGETWDCRADGMRAAYMPPERQYDPTIQDPHRVVRCVSRPNYLWAQHHNGVFRSTDGARSWREVTGIRPSVFGFAVAVHPHDPETAWFVPAIKDEQRIPVAAEVVVSRTRDGGATSEVLRHGLPSEHAYDITYRHGLDVDSQGRTLAFGTTTGSLWLSDDQGDTWQTVAAHLPPIYAVRFVQ